MSDFLPGMKLSELFFRQAVQPILARHWPQLRYSAGRLDFGSDVLGFDTPQSRDHGWGPMVTLYLGEGDHGRYREEILRRLADELPLAVGGYSTHFDDGWCMQAATTRPINHKVTVTTVSRFFHDYTGIDPVTPVAEHDWLAVPPQRLRTIASGRVFHDGLGKLGAARQALAWYPHDVWLYLMANQWRRIDQEEPFMGRCGDVGDGLGSRIVAARMIDNLMRLCFLIERQYVPYYKWVGTAFVKLPCGPSLLPVFQSVLRASAWPQREKHLSRAYEIVIGLHNGLSVTPPVAPEVGLFHSRPYQVPHAMRLVDALHAAICSQTVKSWPAHVGAVSQFTDSTDILDCIPRCQAIAATYSQTTVTG